MRSNKPGGGPERRVIALSGFETRARGDELALEGYASVFDHGYDVMGGPPGGWTEIVDRRAFDKTLSQGPDVHLLINHEGMPLARTKSGTLELSTDTRGLLVRAPNLDRRDPDVQRLEVKMARGDMDEMSFAFRVLRQEWNDDETERRLTEISLHKGDVSVVNFGANPATSAQLGGMNEALALLLDTEPERALAELRSAGIDVGRLECASDRIAEWRDALTPRPSGGLSVAAARALLAED